MKKIILLLALISLTISCQEKKAEIKKNKILKTEKPMNLDWLLGNWERMNEEEGKNTFENWYKKSQTEYIGLGFTMKGSDTISSEKMQLIAVNNKWKLTVRVTGKGNDTSATTFKMINNTLNSFTFENKEIDFPNIIYYKKEGEKLKASISNSEMKIPFEFKRLER